MNKAQTEELRYYNWLINKTLKFAGSEKEKVSLLNQIRSETELKPIHEKIDKLLNPEVKKKEKAEYKQVSFL